MADRKEESSGAHFLDGTKLFTSLDFKALTKAEEFFYLLKMFCAQVPKQLCSAISEIHGKASILNARNAPLKQDGYQPS